MSAFKDAVSKDVRDVFLNVEEFADDHVLRVQGVNYNVACVVDKDLTQEAANTISNPLEGVYLNSITIYIKSDAIASKPVEGELIHLDSELYLVRSVSDEMGVFVIVAEVHNQ